MLNPSLVLQVLPSSIVVMPPEASEYHQTRTKTVDCPNLTFSDNQRSIAVGMTSLNVSRRVVSQPASVTEPSAPS
jgi:hypothetical protein